MVADKEIPKDFQKTELGCLPVDWEIKSLEKFVKITSGESPSTFNFLNFGIPYFKVEQLNNDNKYANETKYFIKTNSTVPSGSLIFPKRGASIFLNKIRILAADSFMDTNLMTLTVSKELDNEYLFYQLSHIGLSKIADTTSIPQINNKHINPFLIPIPPTKTEQTSIATVLNDADNLITELEKLITKKKMIKQGAMQELLKPKEGWEETPLGDVADFYQPKTISQDKFTDEGFLVYGANGIIGKYNKYNHKDWQTIITCRGSTCGTINKTQDKCWITGNAMVANVDKNESVHKLFFYYLLTKQDFSNCITGSGQPQIVRRPLAEFVVHLPKHKSEQERIAQILSDIDSEIESLERKLNKYKMIKQGMMQNLLTGKIRLV